MHESNPNCGIKFNFKTRSKTYNLYFFYSLPTRFPRRPRSGTSRGFWDNCERLARYVYPSFPRTYPRSHIQWQKLSLWIRIGILSGVLSEKYETGAAPALKSCIVVLMLIS